MTKLGPFDTGLSITGLEIATSAGCDKLDELRVLAWSGAPAEMLTFTAAPVVAERELEGGFVAQRVDLEEAVPVAAGAEAGAAFVLSTPASCGALAPGPVDAGRAGRWSAENGWTELDGWLVLWARACE